MTQKTVRFNVPNLHTTRVTATPLSPGNIRLTSNFRDSAIYMTVSALRELVEKIDPPPQAATPAPAAALAVKRRAPKGDQVYAGNGNQRWEEVTVDAKGAGHTYRLRVPGGWIYRTVSLDPDMPNTPMSQSTVFVPMPDVVGYPV